MSEWSKVRLSKSRVPNGTVGSNPTLSANAGCSSTAAGFYYNIWLFHLQFQISYLTKYFETVIEIQINICCFRKVAVAIHSCICFIETP